MKRFLKWPDHTFLAAMSIAISMAAGSAAQAERFQMIELNEDGTKAYLRIDLESGAISRCVQENSIWQCVAVEEQSDASKAVLERRVADLEDRVDQLEAEKLDRPDLTELEDALDMSEQFMRRFFGMVQDMKEDMAR